MYNFLKEYIGKEDFHAKTIFYEINKEEILKLELYLGFSLPNEMKSFFTEIGCGFLNSTKFNNRILSPVEIISIVEKEDFWEFDESVEDFTENEIPILQISEVSMAYCKREDLEKGNSPVFKNGRKISNSFDEFIQKIFNKEILS